MQVRRFPGPYSLVHVGVTFCRDPPRPRTPQAQAQAQAQSQPQFCGIGPLPMDFEDWITTLNWRILDSNDIFYPFRLPRVPTRLAGMRRGEVMPPIYRLVIQATM